MNLWYAGIICSMILAAAEHPQGRRFSSRLMSQMPVLIAQGVNFGIVPLLFIQVAYSKLFYPATILMAWFWLAVIVLLTPAYYGVYLYAFGLYDNERTMRAERVVGWVSAVAFILIGFIFANALTLTDNVAAWPEIWQKTSVGAAATGTGLNLGDARLWPRWLMMFGMAHDHHRRMAGGRSCLVRRPGRRRLSPLGPRIRAQAICRGGGLVLGHRGMVPLPHLAD